MSEREKALRLVQIYKFAVIEANLFCDTHPENKQALEYLSKATKAYMKAREMYVKRFGMLTATDIGDDDRFSWIDSPWPWMNESECER